MLRCETASLSTLKYIWGIQLKILKCDFFSMVLHGTRIPSYELFHELHIFVFMFGLFHFVCVPCVGIQNDVVFFYKAYL